MKILICIFSLFVLSSCSNYIDKPKNLIDKKTMAEIMADMAVNEQMIFTYQGSNLESGTKFILKSYQVKPEDFLASYKYYVVKQKMKGIAEEAQDILIEKDPKAEKFIRERMPKEGRPAPALLK